MSDRRVIKRGLLQRALVCLAVVGVCGLRPNVSAAGQADPKLALIEAIQQAGREKSAAAFLQQIEAADKLVPSADMAAVDSRMRTALHWSVLSAQSASSAKLKDACRRLIEDLLAAGADVNAQDAYGNTPLDYQERSPASLLEEVLIEQGGQRGYTQTAQARVLHLLDQVRAAERDNDLQRLRSLLESDLAANTVLSVRLLTQVASHESRAGDPVEAVVIAPVEEGGRVVVAPGTKIEGTVLHARRASTRYEQAQLGIDFCNLVHHGGGTTPVAALLTEVDNAREQVREGQIVGISFPQAASDRLSWGRSAVGLVHPLLGHALAAAILAWQKGYGREIVLPAGTDMFVRIMAPEKLAAIPGGAVAEAETPAGLADIARGLPIRTTTAGNLPSDLVNVLLVGSRSQVEGAFESAGWSSAQKLGVTSGLKTFASVAQQKGYAEAPVSLLLLEGRKPDLVYQKQTNTFARRHHIRIWKSPQTYEGRELWLGAGTHDIGIAVLKGGHSWYHLVDPQIDREQTKVKDDLLFTGRVGWFSWFDRPGIPRRSMNATGDELRTEGRLLVLWLANPHLSGRARPSGGCPFGHVAEPFVSPRRSHTVIIDRVENVHRYSALGGRIGRALEYMRDANLAALEPGRLELDGRRLYVLVSEYVTKLQHEGRWEAHKRYIDLQAVVAGAERIGYVPATRLAAGPYDEEKDMTWLSGSGPFLPLLPGDFMLLWPGEAHMPGIALDEPIPVRKVVIKIAVDDSTADLR